ncbi:YceI family protein [Chitinophagaceae bacterium LB-8]|uniref:YceI family protein n=1 Tax=Paraflavisolibacter caeni TaxID=2982496 RepID=A0A9X3BEZ6_9BACT|nr:YceI family protein [Paraflavisolibacter caeni]MCU7547989.1 YceI family protein [Paraflavisolibacter caeni]
MRNKLFLAISFILMTVFAQAQDKFFTKSGKINFYSVAPLEDIEAKHKSAVAVLDTKNGTLQFSALIKGFEFENEEMQQHFNEDYMESDKFPKSEFKGQVVNNAAVNYQKPGTYPIQVKGALTIRGVTKEVQTPGTIKVDGDGVKAAATFNVQVADYNIKIPSLVKDKVAKTVKITVDTKLDPLN